MNNQQLNKYIGNYMQHTTQAINISISKTALLAVVADILASEDNQSLLRAINPALSGSFPQFPAFSNVAITSVNPEDGSANISLKIPPVKLSKPAALPIEESDEVITEPTDDMSPDSSDEFGE